MPKVLPIYIISGIMGLLALYAGLADRRVFFIGDARTALITLTVAGFIMCSTGAITAFVSKAPAHPLTMAGYILGALALAIGLSAIYGFNLPYIHDHKTALMVLAGIIVVKVVIARFNWILIVG